MKEIYLDNNASTRVHDSVAEIVAENLRSSYGNPPSLHARGREVSEAIARGRAQVDLMLGSKPGEIVFTAGGTEADNLAVWGAVLAGMPDHRNHVVTVATEHKAVLNTVNFIKRFNVEVTILGVDSRGLVDVNEFADALSDRTAVASVMLANNETGVIQPIPELARIARGRGVPFHTDAVQAVGKIPVNVDDLGADMLSISGHKFYAPKGAGALYVREGTTILPITFGGGQEGGLRSTTENAPGLVGIGEAARLVAEELDERMSRFETLRDRLCDGMRDIWPDMVINGEGAEILPNTLNASLPGVDTAELMRALDAEGVMISAGSACDATMAQPSHILSAMGVEPDLALRTLRISVGIYNEEEDVDKTLEIMRTRR